EHGRGFAVVADEIRLLAERSTESTKRIATLVKSIQGDTYEAVVAMEDSTQEVVKGSQLADDAGRALNSIYTAVERQAQMIEGIARAANEQAQVSENVAIAMGQISEITQQTNVGTQEASMSVSYLAELADQLRASVSTFRLPERTNDMVEIFPDMAGVPALPGGDQFYQQDMEMSNDWNAGFSQDFLSLPQPGSTGNSGSYQFAYNGQQEYASQQNYAGAQPFAGQQGFDAQQYGNQSNANGQYFSTGFSPFNGGNGGLDRNSGDLGGFDMPAAFDEPAQFDFGQDAGFGNNSQGYYPVPPTTARFPQQNAGSQPGQSAFPPMPGQSGQGGMGQVIGPRPRMRNSQQGQPAYSQDQMPYQNGGHLGQ
ncbi:MAG TPA: methyl-accepting chemotaxis protein, partial [Ktedonobacteraceae bacterium]|nr:methyl-accepting chemotaxis protein [Ktedonobacteraceae bacterium]